MMCRSRMLTLHLGWLQSAKAAAAAAAAAAVHFKATSELASAMVQIA
jgi:hypothetical protein